LHVIDPEFWILETAFDGHIPLTRLIGPGLESRFNKSGHGLESWELAALLERLLWEGKIRVVEAGRAPSLYSAADLEALLRDPKRDFRYGLTEKGGARWEELAKPDWTLYVQQCGYGARDSGPTRYEFTAEDRALLERYVEVFFVWSGLACVPGTERWDPVTPWMPTAWKERPSAWRFQALEDLTPLRRERPRWAYEEFGRLSRWCRRSGDSE
jgi:hypothetical protein